MYPSLLTACSRSRSSWDLSACSEISGDSGDCCDESAANSGSCAGDDSADESADGRGLAGDAGSMLAAACDTASLMTAEGSLSPLCVEEQEDGTSRSVLQRAQRVESALHSRDQVEDALRL